VSQCKRDLVHFMALYLVYVYVYIYILLYIQPEDGFYGPKHVAVNYLK